MARSTCTGARSKAQANSAIKRQLDATLLMLAMLAGHGDGETYADCVVCGRKAIVGLAATNPRRFEKGHLVADCNGGEYRLPNLAPMCRRCNDWLGSRNASDVFRPRYDVFANWDGTLVADNGPSAMDGAPDYIPA